MAITEVGPTILDFSRLLTREDVLVYGVVDVTSGSTTIQTGLQDVKIVLAVPAEAPVDGAMHATAEVTSDSTDEGEILIKTWKSTDGDATLITATSNLVVAWFALGSGPGGG